MDYSLTIKKNFICVKGINLSDKQQVATQVANYTSRFKTK